MVDDRIPGTPEPREKRYECTMPGCGETMESSWVPTCPVHKVRMKLTN